MTVSTEQPAVESGREAGPRVSELEDLIREYIRDAIGEDETAGSDPALAFGAAVSMTDLLEDMIAKIDRNLELANEHLARA
jgi:hypothetical protein